MQNYACLHIHIKPAYGNGESDSLCGKICDMHTSGNYANNGAIAYSHKTGMPTKLGILRLLVTCVSAQTNVEMYQACRLMSG